MDEVVVSVVIPTHNAGDLLVAAVDSALEQTQPGVEVIVVDDASTDDTPGRMRPYLGKIKYIRLETNKGPGAARNEGIRNSRGRYVALLDSDDIFMRDRLEKLVHFMDHRPEFGFATTEALYMFGDKPSEQKYFDVPQLIFRKDDQEVHILRSNFVGNKLMFRRELFEKYGLYDESLWFEDWAKNLEFIMAGERCGFIDEPLAYHRVRSGSLTSRSATVLEDRQKVLLRWLATDLGRAQRAAALTALSEMRWAQAWTPQSLSDRDAFRRVMKTLVTSPGPLQYRIRGVLGLVIPFTMLSEIRRARSSRIEEGGGHWALREASAKLQSADVRSAKAHVLAVMLHSFPIAVRITAFVWLFFPPGRLWATKRLLTSSRSSFGAP